MKKLLYLLLLLPAMLRAQQLPVTVTQPYIFQKWISVKDSILFLGTLNNSDSSHKVATTAFVKQNAATLGSSYVKKAGTETITGNKTSTGVNAFTGNTTISGNNVSNFLGSKNTTQNVTYGVQAGALILTNGVFMGAVSGMYPSIKEVGFETNGNGNYIRDDLHGQGLKDYKPNHAINDSSYITKHKLDSAITVGVSSKADTGLIDVFTIAGQSNALGSSQQPSLATLLPANISIQFWNGVLKAGGEPWGNSNGSAWNAFAVQYYQLTGHKICLVQSAVAGTALVPAANPSGDSWDPTGGGTLYAKSIARTDSALIALTNAGYRPKYKGVLWSQGEADGSYAGITASAYTSALIRLINAYRSHYAGQSWFYTFRTGEYGSGATPYKPVRLWQEQVADTALYTKVVYRNAISFYSRGLMRTDSTHYTQVGYNEMGRMGAVEVVSKLKSQLHYEYNAASANNFNSSVIFPTWKVGQAIPIDRSYSNFADTVSTSTSSAGIAEEMVYNVTANNANAIRGIKAYHTVNLSGFNLTNASSGASAGYFQTRISGTGTLTNLASIYSRYDNVGAGTITNGFGAIIDNPSNSGGGALTNATGLFIKQQSAGTNNTQLHLGNTTIAPPAGNWSLYNNSANPSYIGSTMIQNGAVPYDFYNGTYDAVNFQKVRVVLSSNVFNIGPFAGGTQTVVPKITIGNTSKLMTWDMAPGTLGSVFTMDHGTTSGSQIFTSNVTGNFTATGNNVYSSGITPTLVMTSTASWTGQLISPLVTSIGGTNASNYFVNYGTNTAAKGTGTHTRLFSVNLNGGIFSNVLTAGQLVQANATTKELESTTVLPNGTTATTQAPGTNNTTVATMGALFAERTATATLSGKTFLTGFNINGSSSGVVTEQVQAAAGTYNWNLPITAGASGQMLVSGGGGANPMTWFTPYSGSFSPVSPKTANYTALVTDSFIPVDATAGNVTITLPTGAGIFFANAAGQNVGIRYIVKKTDLSVNTVTVAGTIDGTTNAVIGAQNASITVQANSTTTYLKQ